MFLCPVSQRIVMRSLPHFNYRSMWSIAVYCGEVLVFIERLSDVWIQKFWARAATRYFVDAKQFSHLTCWRGIDCGSDVREYRNDIKTGKRCSVTQGGSTRHLAKQTWSYSSKDNFLNSVLLNPYEFQLGHVFCHKRPVMDRLLATVLSWLQVFSRGARLCLLVMVLYWLQVFSFLSEVDFREQQKRD